MQGIRPLYSSTAVQRHKQREHIGKAEPAVDAAAHSGAVAELHAHDMAHSLPHCAMGVRSKSGVRFQLRSVAMAPMANLGVGLLDGIQPQTGQVDGCADIDLFPF